jgi:hypothetical protein
MATIKSDHKIGFMGIGDVGCAVVTRFARTHTLHQRCILINSLDVPFSAMDPEPLQKFLTILIDLRDPQARESSIQQYVADLDTVIMVSAMGGRTGSLLVPLIANMIKNSGVQVSILVTTPFSFEGKKTKNRAFEGISKLHNQAHDVLTLSNESRLDLMDQNISIAEAYLQMDLKMGRGIELLMQLGEKTGS